MCLDRLLNCLTSLAAPTHHLHMYLQEMKEEIVLKENNLLKRNKDNNFNKFTLTSNHTLGNFEITNLVRLPELQLMKRCINTVLENNY